MSELQNFLNNSQENYDIICIQETWYKKNDKPFNLKGYQSPINRIRTENCGGGLCMYVKYDIQFIEKYTHFTPEISLKPYDVTLCLPCCIVGLFGGKLRF